MFERVVRSFTIAFTPRSGSNAICDILALNGVGAANEWFQLPLTPRDGEPWLDAFIRRVNEKQAGGVFGSKMSHNHRAALDADLRQAIPGYRRLDDVLPDHRWLQLVRKDKVLQAISLCRAESSNRWAATDATQMQSGEFEYDFFHVLSRLMTIQTGELAWDVYFQQHGIEPFRIVYEDFFQDLEPQLGRLIDYLGGLPPGRASLEVGPQYKIQRDEISNQLRERFISDLNRLGDPSFAAEIGPPWDRWLRFFSEHQWRSPRNGAH
jgi:LPS sulfotransferase NodH